MQNDELKLLRLYRGADDRAKVDAISLLEQYQKTERKAQANKEPTPIISIGRVSTIEEAMRRRGCSIAEMCGAIGMTERTYKKYAQSLNFTANEIDAICDYLGLNDDEAMAIFFS